MNSFSVQNISPESLPGESSPLADNALFYGGIVLLVATTIFFFWWVRAIRKK